MSARVLLANYESRRETSSSDSFIWRRLDEVGQLLHLLQHLDKFCHLTGQRINFEASVFNSVNELAGILSNGQGSGDKGQCASYNGKRIGHVSAGAKK